MSLRVDTSPLIANSLIVGDTGLGVLAQNVPSTGELGPGYVYDSLAFPADQDVEVRGLITVPISGPGNVLHFFAYEDTSFDLVVDADGTYTFEFELFKDGVSDGTAVASVEIGDGVITAASLHGHIASSPTLTQGHVLSVSGSLHGHAAQESALSLAAALVALDAVHGNVSSDVALEVLGLIDVAGSLHAQLSGEASLTSASLLQVLGSVHAQISGDVAFPSDVVLTHPGMEWTLVRNRPHWTLARNRLHWTLNRNRTTVH